MPSTRAISFLKKYVILESNTLQNVLVTRLPLKFCLRKLKCHGKTAVVSYTNQLVASFFKYYISCQFFHDLGLF